MSLISNNTLHTIGLEMLCLDTGLAGSEHYFLFGALNIAAPVLISGLLNRLFIEPSTTRDYKSQRQFLPWRPLVMLLQMIRVESYKTQSMIHTDERKLVVVLGATGAQGMPIAKYLLANSPNLFRVRAITRDISKPLAVELAALGAEVIAADFSDEPSIRRAFAHANAIFAITNFWDQASYDLEVFQGKLINRIASEIQELDYYLFSSLADGRQIQKGRFQNILPYNAKAAILEDLKGSYPELWNKTIEVWVAYYFQNWLKYNLVFGPQKDANGTFVLSMPFSGASEIPSAWADDVGPVVDALLKSGDKYYQKTVSVVADPLSQEKMLDIWAKSKKFHS